MDLAIHHIAQYDITSVIYYSVIYRQYIGKMKEEMLEMLMWAHAESNGRNDMLNTCLALS